MIKNKCKILDWLSNLVLFAFIAIDVLFRLFEDYLIIAFSFMNANVRLTSICIIIGLYIVKEILKSILRRDSKMLKFLKRLFIWGNREYRKYKVLLKDPQVKQVIQDVLEKKLSIVDYIEKAKEQLASKHTQEIEAMAKQLAEQK